MAAPAPQQPQRPVYGPLHLSLLLVIAAVVLMVLAAFAAGGDSLGDIPAWSWAFGALAAWFLSSVVP